MWIQRTFLAKIHGIHVYQSNHFLKLLTARISHIDKVCQFTLEILNYKYMAPLKRQLRDIGHFIKRFPFFSFADENCLVWKLDSVAIRTSEASKYCILIRNRDITIIH